MSNARALVDRYVAIWNEPDAARRRRAVAGLWSEDALHLLQPPQTTRDAAGALAVEAVFQARGHEELDARVTHAYEEFVASGGYSFRFRGEAMRLGDVVKFRWEMVSKSRDVAGVGLEFLILAADGRIRMDCQFIET